MHLFFEFLKIAAKYYKTLLNMYLNYNPQFGTLDSYFNSKYLVYSERNK